MSQAEPSSVAPRAVTRRRYLPALLDAVVPGLGHLAAGRLARAALFGLPSILVVGLLAGVAVSAGPVRLGSLALDDRVLLALIGFQAVILLWRLAAMASSLLNPRLPRLRGRDAIPVALVALIAIGPQAYLGYATNVAREEVNVVFAPSTTGSGAWKPAAPTADPGASAGPESSAGPSATPAASPSPAGARTNVLIIGVDAGVGRSTFLTDTLIVASLDPVTETVSLLSLARDMVDVPLPGGRTYSGKINSLLSYARLHPGEFPGSSGDGHDVLMAAVGTLLGLDIEQYAQVDLGGFVAVVDSLGGVDVNVAHAVVKGGFLNDPIGFLKAIGQAVQTNVPRSVIVPLADVARRVDRSKTYRAVVTYPLVRPGFDVRGSIQLPDIAGIRALAASLFPPPGTVPAVAYAAPAPTAARASGSGVSSCLPAPTPRPTAKPIPKPSPSTVASPPGSAPPDGTPPPAEPSASPKPSGASEPSPSPAP